LRAPLPAGAQFVP